MRVLRTRVTGSWFPKGFMGKKAGRVEGKTGQGLSPFFSGSKALGAALSPGTCRHVSVRTGVSWDGVPGD